MTPDTSVMLNDGRTIPRLGFGVWRLEDADAEPLVGAAIDVGYRHIDTAQGYGNEAGVGRAIRESSAPREELFITSKLRNGDQGFDSARRSFDGTMDRLGIDVLDLFLIHWPTPARGLYAETWKAFVALQTEGRVRSIGVSNFLPEHIERIVGETGVTPAVNQLELHPAYQQRDVREFHAERDIVIESYSPLGGDGAALLRDPVIVSIAEKHGRTPAQVVLRWHLRQGFVPLPKSATPARIAENFAVWDFRLDDDDMARMVGLDRADGKRGPLPERMNNP